MWTSIDPGATVKMSDQRDDDVLANDGSGVQRSMKSTHHPLTVLRCKVAIVGDSKVGKTALKEMFISGGRNYLGEYNMTAGVDFKVKSIPIPDTNVEVELYMFDCGGEKIFQQREGYSAYFENTAMCAVIYDVGTPTTLQSCGRWLSAVRHSRPDRPIPGVLIANKVDLYKSKPDCLNSEAGQRFASTNGLKFFEASAKENQDVDAPFNFLANEFYRQYQLHLETVKKNTR